MSFKVKKLTVGKGRTLERNGDPPEWIRQYYEVELAIQDDRDLEIAKVSVESLIDGWLTAQPSRQSPRKPLQTIPDIPGRQWDPNQLEWLDKEGAKGPYETCEDYNNPNHRAMLTDLAAHNGKMQRDGFFYWTFQNGTTVGRKKVKRRRSR